MKKLGVLALLLLVLFCGEAFGQTESSAISGRIVDQSGAVVVGAEVRVVNIDTNVERKTTTNLEGFYLVPSLNPGRYRILIKKEGFRQIVKTEITLNVQDVLAENFKLELGAVSEAVTVVGDDAHIDTTDASVSTVIDRQFAENLPLNGRSFQSLLYLTPGVTLNIGSGVSSTYASGQISVNGQRADSNYWMVDGVSANIGITSSYIFGTSAAGSVGAVNVLGGTNSLISVDAMQEFRIQTSTYAPEFGRTPGGQISIVSRSGSNQFHGSLFDYLRNTVLDATDWFANANGLPKAGEKQNDFGGVIGGPVVKNRTFFFFSYEGMRLRLPQTQLTTVPDLAARQSAIPAMQPFFDAFPMPNPGAADVGPGIAPFNASFSNPASVNAYSLRIDHSLAKRWNVFGRYNYSPSTLVLRGSGLSLNDVSNTTFTTNTGTVGATWTKSSKVVNDLRFNYSSLNEAASYFMDHFGGGEPAPGSSLFPKPLTYENSGWGLLALFGTSMLYAQGLTSTNHQHQFNVVDGLSMQHGPHDLKIGVDYRRLSPRLVNSLFYEDPYFQNIGDMEAGLTSFETISPGASATFLFHNLGVYAQDTWRVSPRLTLTYGLRWDVDFAPSTENGFSLATVTGFSYTDPSNVALAPSGTAIYRTRYGNVAPRVGGAYQISQSADWGLVFRGGFGIFYDLASTEAITHSVYYYPFETTYVFSGASFPMAQASLPPILPPDASQGGLIGWDPHLNQPYSLQWSGAFEQALGKDQTLTVSYVGSSGRRLLLTESVTNPNPNYLSAILVGNAGSSNYNSLQLQFQRRLARGLQALASYSWAHSIDTGSYGAYSDGSFANANVNKGDSDFDIRNTFSGALTYQLPALTKSTFAQAILGGWSTENIVQIRSAPPVSVVDGAFAALAHANSSIVIRPDVVPDQPFYLYGPQYPGGKALNPNALTGPPVDPTSGLPLRQGTLGRNVLRAFGTTQWDFAIHRDFPLHEMLKLQFRAEMFNVLNHPNFAPYDVNFGVADPLFGQATQMYGQGLTSFGGAGSLSSLYQIGGPRSVQIALKMLF
jgi:hypothetical protein